MEQRVKKIYSKEFPDVVLRVIPGHFMTSHSHINYYVDMTYMKMRQSEAQAVARAIASKYSTTAIIDTIVCMDGCEVIGAYLAEELSAAGIMSMNAHKTIYITSPEYSTGGQIIFRQNIVPMIENKNILLLFASATTGQTLLKCVECIDYYKGHVAGITSIFSAIHKIADIPVESLFQISDLPDYKNYPYKDCPLCKNGVPIDAIVNGFGYSTL
ncbi:MAG TPA: orotate phosphoribosyltransferase [Lachnospiraceae bacterium]|nr:orotate phosphoribosyltransferase [Lachnospiraceae bacterium]